MIDKIYEVIADKTLSFGCMVEITKKVKWYYSWSVKYWYWYITESMIWIDCSYTWYDIANDNISVYLKNWVYRPMISMEKNKVVIIWHPVMLGDVLDRYEKLPHAEVYTDNSLVIVKAWKDKRKPIEEQPETLIEYIYNLLP